VLAGVVEIDDLNGAGKVVIGEIPDPDRAVGKRHFPFRPAPTAAPSFGVDAETEVLSRLDCPGIRGGALIAHRTACVVGGGLYYKPVDSLLLAEISTPPLGSVAEPWIEARSALR
jgi:hypothetical protein